VVIAKSSVKDLVIIADSVPESVPTKISDFMNILVTGGAGFIGSHLCRQLLKQGHYVICLDNFFTGSIENIKDLRANPNFELIRHDIVDTIHIECDQIYNLACPASPVHYQRDPIKTIKTSTYAMVNMLELALQTRARILQTSTSEIYGDPLEHPQKESYLGHVNCIGPRSSYDEGKRVAESLMMAYHKEKGVDIRIARLFNTYGPNLAMNDGRVVSNFIIQALRGQNITVYGSGSQTRSFCYISDMIEALIKLMNKDSLFILCVMGEWRKLLTRTLTLMLELICLKFSIFLTGIFLFMPLSFSFPYS